MSCFLCFCSAVLQSATCGLHYGANRDKEVDIQGCIFKDLSNAANGGAILINIRSSSVHISFDSFENCSALGDPTKGGAIFCLSNSLNLSSVCCSVCSAWHGSFFFLESNAAGHFYMRSVSASQRFKDGIPTSNSIYSSDLGPAFTFCNISDTFEMEYGAAIFLFSIVSSYLGFWTVSNSSKCLSLFHYEKSEYSKIEMSNIIGNDALRIESIANCELISTFDSCVFVRNTLLYLISSEDDASKQCVVTMERCWLDESEESIVSMQREFFQNLTLQLCNFTDFNTLSFIDLNLIANGVTCGIRLPSPSQSPLASSSNYLSGLTISLIVTGVIAFCASIGGFIWYFTRKSIRNSIHTDVETISLLRNIESAYG